MVKELYEIGETPPTGYVPPKMYASVIRPDRYGPPEHAMQTEVVDVPPLGRGQVLIYVMAAGINYNNVWASFGKPLDVIATRRRQGEPENFHIGGSDGSGVVWAVADDVSQVRVGDHVVLSACQWDETAFDIRAGADPTTSVTARIWGYESNFGTFAQFAVAYEYQCHPKPVHLPWSQAAAFMVTGATAYRQLMGWHPNVVRPGDPVLIWGGAGGLGSMAIQIVREFGGIPVAVVSSDERSGYCRQLGSRGVIDRREFSHWGPTPDNSDTMAYGEWMSELRRFRSRFWEAVGERRSPMIVFEHPGRDTLPTSILMCDPAGMVVTCGATTGYSADLDLRLLWMKQKRLQGSHYANFAECRAITELVATSRIDPCTSSVGALDDVGKAHQMMHDNVHPPGNMTVLINATTEETL